MKTGSTQMSLALEEQDQRVPKGSQMQIRLPSLHYMAECICTHLWVGGSSTVIHGKFKVYLLTRPDNMG